MPLYRKTLERNFNWTLEAFKINADGPTPTPDWFKPHSDPRIEIIAEFGPNGTKGEAES